MMVKVEHKPKSRFSNYYPNSKAIRASQEGSLLLSHSLANLGPTSSQSDQPQGFPSSNIRHPSYEDIENEVEQGLHELEIATSNPHRSLSYILLLTIIIGGLQLSWSVEFSQGTPFLLSLGISKRTLALIWIAGPLSGSLGHPIIGLLSDMSMNPKGRRRSFIITGCVFTVISMLALSYSVDIIGALFFHWRNSDDQDHDVMRATIPFAAFSIYFIDFSIAVIQASSRAYIVDNVPTHQQQLSNAFAAILIGAFNIIGFFLGAIDLNAILPFLGSSQFKALATIACLTLVSTTILSLTFIKERNPTTDPVMKLEREKTDLRFQELGLINQDKNNGGSIFQMVVFLYKQTLNSVLRLSPQVKIVCFVEFFAWIGYFPMLFYTTTYVGDLYLHEFWSIREPNLPPLTDIEIRVLNEESIRRGSLALLAHSIVSFLTDILLPLLAKPVKQSNDYFSSKNPILGRIELFRQKYLPNLTVRLTWIISHFIFILCMMSTFMISSSTAAIFMFGVLGISWGVALWSPFVLISEEVSRIKEVNVSQFDQCVDSNNTDNNEVDHQDTLLKIQFGNYEHEPGIILGIHNFFVAAPQMISSFASSILFAFLANSHTDGTSTDDVQFSPSFDNSIAWVFRFGGLAAIWALWLSLKVKKDEDLWNEADHLLQKQSSTKWTTVGVEESPTVFGEDAV